MLYLHSVYVANKLRKRRSARATFVRNTLVVVRIVGTRNKTKRKVKLETTPMLKTTGTQTAIKVIWVGLYNH